MTTILVVLLVASPLWFYPLAMLLSERGVWTMVWWLVGVVTLFSVIGVAIATHEPSNTQATPPLAVCWDGTKVSGWEHQGVCSHHGGVKEWLR